MMRFQLGGVFANKDFFEVDTKLTGPARYRGTKWGNDVRLHSSNRVAPRANASRPNRMRAFFVFFSTYKILSRESLLTQTPYIGRKKNGRT
jgi:hypothetical protein